MFNKIDKELLGRIFTQEQLHKDLNVIVYSNEYLKTKDALHENLEEKDIIELPFISSFAVTTNYTNLYKLASINSVNYITGDAKVCSLIYKSKQFINIESLYEKIQKYERHSCVVIDTGVYPHIDFCLGKNRIIKFVDLMNKKEKIYDDNGHGTFVTGILCANSITSNCSGIDSTADIIVIKALDSDGETSSIKILEAMQWVLDNKAKYNIKVVCMSFGSVIKDQSDPLVFGAEILWDNGVVVVTAAGNSGPADSTIMSPGASKKVITVGSLDKINLEKIQVADFSSRGPVFNYYKPDMLLPGVDITSNNIFSSNKKFYTQMTGTSVSTPMVAGVVSLLYDINPDYTPDQIKYMLINSCIKLTGDRNSEGYGRLDLKNLILL